MREGFVHTKYGGRNTCWDVLMASGILMTGAAEASHLAAVVLKWPFGRCCVLFWVLTGIAWICEAALCMGLRKRSGQKIFVFFKKRRPDKGETAAWILFGALAVSQIIFVCMKDSGVRQGDIMVETVGSFLATDSVYQVNPMTGGAYSEGIPLRLKILCLPFLYGSICRITGLSAAAVVRTVAPALTLAACYISFAALGNSLFLGGPHSKGVSEQNDGGETGRAGSRRGYAWFMAAAALMVWVSSGVDGMEGYRLFYSGWQGVTIRNCVLMPWLLSLCLRRKWMLVPLCVLAEACITWTLYGMGVCFASALLMAAIQICSFGLSVARRKDMGLSGYIKCVIRERRDDGTFS